MQTKLSYKVRKVNQTISDLIYENVILRRKIAALQLKLEKTTTKKWYQFWN